MGKRLVAIWVTLGVAVFATVYLVTFQEKLRLDLDHVAHIRETLSLVYDLENQLAVAESAARGYALTKDENQLGQYQAANKEIDRAFAALYQLTVYEAGRRKLLDGLKPLIEKRQALFQKFIDLSQQSEGEKERQAVLKDGAKLQDRIRKSLEKLEDRENRLLNPQWARELRRARIIVWVLTAGAFASFSLLFVLVYLLNREIGVRKQAESQVAAYQDNLRSLASSLSLAEERERRRLAVYLHDQIGHTLALANIKLGELQKSLGHYPGFPTSELEKTGSLLEQAIRDTHSLTFKISSPILYELGLTAALEWLTEQVQKDHGISTRFIAVGRTDPLDDDIRVLLFQAVNELLVNVVKHAQAKNIEVSIQRKDGNLTVNVGDDGVGFQMPQIGPPRRARCGFGLFSIRERLRPYGGILEVQSEPEAGTHITLTVPLANAVTADKSYDHQNSPG
ncbi:MAG: CHASE3 domain-containing protein [Deltaproteobacteria bacterium]|nr:CHASE3 domain-containing protein [Deltaproteobacteria bacterium]